VFHWTQKKTEIHKPTSIFEMKFFFCPKCDRLAPYKLRRASVDFTFYYLSLFEVRTLHEFVVCQVCKKGFDPKVLSPGIQSLLKLVGATRCELSRFSAETLRSKLLRDGLNEPLIDTLITLAKNS
jgi:hypothetical protein